MFRGAILLGIESATLSEDGDEDVTVHLCCLQVGLFALQVLSTQAFQQMPLMNVRVSCCNGTFSTERILT